MSRYRTQARDTSIEVERVLIARYRAMAPAEKIQIFGELSRASQELALAGIRRRHPDASAEELRMRLAETRVGAQALREIFGWDGGEPADDR